MPEFYAYVPHLLLLDNKNRHGGSLFFLETQVAVPTIARTKIKECELVFCYFEKMDLICFKNAINIQGRQHFREIEMIMFRGRHSVTASGVGETDEGPPRTIFMLTLARTSELLFRSNTLLGHIPRGRLLTSPACAFIRADTTVVQQS